MELSGEGKGAWVRWTVGTIISLIGAGVGLVALLQYQDQRREAADREYRKALAAWESFAPSSVSRGVHEVEIPGGHFIDLDDGLVAMSLIGRRWDLQFRVERDRDVGSRANVGVEWASLGVVEFSEVGYRELRDAPFAASSGSAPEGNDLFLSHPTSAPGPGTSYAVKTSRGDVAQVQIVRYTEGGPLGTRGMWIRYEVFPVVPDPPRPRRR